MAGLHEIRAQLLNDRKISCSEVEIIKDFMARDGRLDYEDIKFLVGLMKDANHICQEFDDLFFPCMREVILADGKVTLDEQFLLLQMLYSDGQVRDSEKKFIAQLYRDVKDVTPELQQLCETALNCSGTDWELGGE